MCIMFILYIYTHTHTHALCIYIYIFIHIYIYIYMLACRHVYNICTCTCVDAPRLGPQPSHARDVHALFVLSGGMVEELRGDRHEAAHRPAATNPKPQTKRLQPQTPWNPSRSHSIPKSSRTKARPSNPSLTAP